MARNLFKTIDNETGEDCASSPGDYFMYAPDELLPMTLLRQITSIVTMPDGQEVITTGWYVVGEPVTRRYLKSLRDRGDYFIGDTYTVREGN